MAIDKALLTTLSEDESKKVRRLVEKGIKLPPQPAVLEELNHLLRRGVSDVRILARSISQDPGIVAALFKVAQSSAFASLQPLESIEHVLQAIGIKQTYNIVQAVSLVNAVPAKHNAKAFEAFWVRSRAVAQLAMLVAEERVSVCNIFPDQAYLAGIFHDCGVPMLLERFPDYCAALRTGTGQWIDVIAEDQRLDVDHAVVGHLIARHWRLPDFIAEAVLKHHEMPPADTGGAARSMVAILQLANELYHREQLIPNPEWPNQRHAVMVELCIHEGELESFMDDLLESTYA